MYQSVQAFLFGDYGSNDANSSASGFAKTGTAFDLSFAYKLEANVGITGLFRSQTNNVDNNALASQLAAQSPTVSWQVSTQAWSMDAFMGGIYASYPMNASATSFFEVRGLLGIINISSPQVTVTGTNGVISTSAEEASASATSFAYLIGGGFRFNLGTTMCLLLNVDYLGSKPQFNDAYASSSQGNSTQGSFSQSVGSVNVSAGIAFRLE